MQFPAWTQHNLYDICCQATAEQCRDQHQDVSMVFVDLTKAFDTVNRYVLWNILFSRLPTLVDILQQFHAGMCALVVIAGSQSSSFPIDVGVKQG